MERNAKMSTVQHSLRRRLLVQKTKKSWFSEKGKAVVLDRFGKYKLTPQTLANTDTYFFLYFLYNNNMAWKAFTPNWEIKKPANTIFHIEYSETEMSLYIGSELYKMMDISTYKDKGKCFFVSGSGAYATTGTIQYLIEEGD